MSQVLQMPTLQDTILWKHLSTNFRDSADSIDAAALGQMVVSICEGAADRMKLFVVAHPEYTLHDEGHLLRVTELTAYVLGATLKVLSPVEIALLILAAYFHDQGMVIEGDEHKTLLQSPDFKIFRDTWILEHPNYREVQEQLADGMMDANERARVTPMEAELRSAMISDYIRRDHGRRSAEYARRFACDKRFEVSGANLAGLVALLCESHVQPPSWLMGPNGFRVDELVGRYKVNLVYLALVLRLADILDFDRDRTPDERACLASSRTSAGGPA